MSNKILLEKRSERKLKRKRGKRYLRGEIFVRRALIEELTNRKLIYIT